MITTALIGLAWLSGTPVLIGAAVFAAQIFAAGRRQAAGAAAEGAETWNPALRIAILVPAHNESAVIERSLQSLTSQLARHDQLLVIADNCTDDTAIKARAAGAAVLERQNLSARGKGYALAYGMDALRAAPPDIVVIVDADCWLAPGSLRALASEVVHHQRPAQALYLMRAPAAPTRSQRVAEFAWRVRNQTRPTGAARLGWPCQLMGTGMAFSWAMLEKVELGTASIVEDMQLGLDLAAQGMAPRFCPGALVTSEFPQQDATAATQRARWEHGHVDMIRHRALPLLISATRRADWRSAALALDLAVPPLALLSALLIACTMASALLWSLTAYSGWLQANLVASGLFAAAVVRAWSLAGRDLISTRELLSLPLYVLKKLPALLRYVTQRQRAWIKTDRS